MTDDNIITDVLDPALTVSTEASGETTITIEEPAVAPATFTITTDQLDYAPGSTATFTVTGATEGGGVTFAVADDPADPGDDNVVNTYSFTVVDGGTGDADGLANGTVVADWSVPSDGSATNATLNLTATDEATGAMAAAVFTDAGASITIDEIAGDDIINAIEAGTGFTISGSMRHLAGGVTVNLGGVDYVATVIGGTSHSPGSWSVTLTGAQASALADGPHTVTASADSDDLGTAPDLIASRSITVDTASPALSHGVLLAPTGASPTGNEYNPTHWAVLDGDTIAGTIIGAADAVEADGSTPEDGDTVLVVVKSGTHGNTELNGTFDALGADNAVGGGDDNTITFTWTVQSPDGSDICDTTVVAYATTAPGPFENVSSAGTDRFGFAIVNADGSPHECDDDVTATLSLTKDTVCADEGDSVNGGTLLVGSSVEWVYTLTAADGSVSDITLTDNQNGTDFIIYDGTLHGDATLEYTLGDTDGVLEEGEVWTFKLTGDVVRGDYSNTATATGNDAATGDAVVPAESEQNSYTGVAVADDSVVVVKEVSVDGGTTWLDADDPSGPTLLAGFGDPQYRFTITNNSDVSLDIFLNDSTLGVVNQVITLASGDSTTTVPITAAWADGQNTNTAEVSATFTDACDNSATPSDSDVANYFGAAPSLTIDKYILCADGDKGPFGQGDDTTVPNLLSGDVNYVFEVTNTGNVRLDNLIVTDDPALTLTLSGDLSTGEEDGFFDEGDKWVYTAIAAWAAGEQLDTATAMASYTDSAGNIWAAGDGEGVSDSASYFGLNPHITLNKLTNGSDGADLLQGQAITWTYDVKNDGNVDNLSGLVVTDNPAQTMTAIVDGSGYNTGDTNHDGNLDVNETWHFKATGMAVDTSSLPGGVYSNMATATTVKVYDDCGDSLTPSDDDGSSYTGHARAVEGLTKGYWATHATLWDVVSGDEKGAGSELNIAPGYDWNNNGTKAATTLANLNTTGPSSGLGLVKTANNGGGDSGLLMGDLNHDGLVTGDGSSDHLFFDLASAQALANSSVVGDARIILAGQAVAAQLNQYQAYVTYGADSSPDGLISDAVQWLKGQGPLSFDGSDSDLIGDSNVNAITANDVAGVATVINRGTTATNDYTLSGGAITLKGTALSASTASWQTKALVFDEFAAGIDISGDGILNDTVWANGEGLKNALAAYNHGLSGTTAGFVTSQDGTLIGWEGSIGGTPTDVHANDPDVFWGILANQGITGVDWHLV